MKFILAVVAISLCFIAIAAVPAAASKNCFTMCNDVYAQVCATNQSGVQQTFSNSCYLSVANCPKKRKIKWKNDTDTMSLIYFKFQNGHSLQVAVVIKFQLMSKKLFTRVYLLASSFQFILSNWLV